MAYMDVEADHGQDRTWGSGSERLTISPTLLWLHKCKLYKTIHPGRKEWEQDYQWDRKPHDIVGYDGMGMSPGISFTFAATFLCLHDDSASPG